MSYFFGPGAIITGFLKIVLVKIFALLSWEIIFPNYLSIVIWRKVSRLATETGNAAAVVLQLDFERGDGRRGGGWG
jgi:hypothetical protein